MSTIPSNAAAGCPGTENENAGKSSACAGCPNQNICSSGIKQNDDHIIEAIRKRLSLVDKKILILSGKGGVGKSTLTTLLARTFARKSENENFGVLDIDICGPSIPRMLGVAQESVHQSGSGWSPVYVEDNLCLMSLGFLLSSPDDAIIWRGPKKNGIIRQFLSEVDWGCLDYLFFDTPPGTSDEHMSSISYLNKASTGIGAIIVTTPQEVSLLDVRKQITFCRKLNIPIIGVIENMSSFVCGHCKTVSEIFPSKTGGAKTMCKEMEVDYLGSLPLNPFITKNCDYGKDFSDLDDATLGILNNITDRIIANILKICK